MKMADLRTLIASIPTSADTYDVSFAAPASPVPGNIGLSMTVEVDNGDYNIVAGAPVYNRTPAVILKP